MQWVNVKNLDWQIDVIWDILTNTKLQEGTADLLPDLITF